MKKLFWLFIVSVLLTACAEEAPEKEEAAPELADHSDMDGTLTVRKEEASSGQALFEANCTACHRVCGPLIGPDLHGVQERWQNDSALFAFVKNSQKVISDGHPRAVAVFNQYNQQVMTPQMLDNEEITVVLEYIQSVNCSK